MKKYDPDVASGLVEEAELEAIVSGDAQGGTTPVIPVVSAITAISALTFNATPCPTSACTKSC